MAIIEDGLNILGRIENNAQNLQLLLKYLDRLVPFVGAGLSSHFGYPNWNKPIEDLADQAGLRSQVDSLLANYQFEEAAEVLANTFPNLFDDTLRAAFDKRKTSAAARKRRRAPPGQYRPGARPHY